MKVERTIVACRGRNSDNPSDRKTKSNGNFVQMLESLGGGSKTNTLTTVTKDRNMCHYKSCVVFKDGKGNHLCLPKESDKSGCVSTRMDLLENTRRMGPIFVICYVPA